MVRHRERGYQRLGADSVGISPWCSLGNTIRASARRPHVGRWLVDDAHGLRLPTADLWPGSHTKPKLRRVDNHGRAYTSRTHGLFGIAPELGFTYAPGWIRTSGLPLRRRTLYPLSYGRSIGGDAASEVSELAGFGETGVGGAGRRTVCRALRTSCKRCE
jgi:hypothetical protein